MHDCRICGVSAPAMRRRIRAPRLKCVERNADFVDASARVQPFEGDPELARFAREEGSSTTAEPGTRKRPR